MSKWIVGFAAATILCVLPATAGEGWIAGLSAGQAQLNDFRLTTDSIDDHEVVWMAMGGYQFLKNFAVVGGYLDLGDYHAEGPSFGGYVDDIKIKGFYVRSLGILPVSSFVSLIGSLGAYRWDYDFKDLDIPTGNRRHQTDTGISPTFGLGVDVDLSTQSAHFRGLNLHAGWERLKDVGDRHKVEHVNDYDIFMIGLTYNFTP